MRTITLHVEADQRFGRLVVVEETRATLPSGKSVRAAACRCDCGVHKVVPLTRLCRGRTRSCGCMAKVWHPGGRDVDPLYDVWRGVVERCHNPKATSYARYGGRGVTVYEPWRESFERFKADVEREIGPGPDGRYPSGKPRYSLDRIENSRGYEPGNIKWSTASDQQRNTRNRVGKSSPYRGVSWDAHNGRWLAQGYVDGKRRTIGRYDSPEAARDAREAATAASS